MKKERKRGRRDPNRHEREAALHKPDLRDRRSHRYSEKTIPPEFRKLVEAVLLPQVALTGYKMPEQRRVALYCLHNAVCAGLVGDTVADTRQNKPGVLLRVRVWDALVAAGLVVKELGSEASGMDTRYLATPRLLAHFRDWPLQHHIHLQLGRNTMTPDKCSWDALVVLRESRKEGGKLLPIPRGERDACLGGVSVGAYLEGVEDDIEIINRANLRHAWTAYKELPDGRLRAFPPNFCLKQMHSGNLLRYARLFTWSAESAQSLTKRERRMMEIDGEPVAEFDYGQHNIRLLYHVLGIEPAPGDLYRPERILPGAHADARTRPTAREFIKVATNVLLNTASPAAAARGVQELIFKNPVAATVLRREGITARHVVDRIMAAHPDVAHRFFTMVGADLQTIDGMVMRRVLMAFAKVDRPALGIHDSVVCRVSDAGFAEAWMTIEYLRTLGFEPVVRQAY